MNEEPFVKLSPELPEPECREQIAEKFKAPSRRSRQGSTEQQHTPEYITAIARLNDSTNYRPGLTAQQQYIMELVKAQIQAEGCLSSHATERAMRSADVVFGE